MVLNDDANWNNKQKQTKEKYLDNYMSNNLYWLQCSTKSEWDLETIKDGKPVIERSTPLVVFTSDAQRNIFLSRTQPARWLWSNYYDEFKAISITPLP